MNLRLRNEAAFFAEYQNEPIVAENVAGEIVADEIAAKTNGMKRGEVPISATRLTMFIDVQQKLLFYAVVAWDDNFTGYIVDYGSYPDQDKPNFLMRDATKTIQAASTATGLEGQIYGALNALTQKMLPKEFQRDDGAQMRIDRCLIDANWGASTDIVYQFCRQSNHATVILPTHGKYVGASSTPFSEYTRRPGDRVGLNWRIPNLHGKRAVRHAVYDTNFWKSFVQSRWGAAMGDAGCLSIFGKKAEEHRMFAQHMTAEYRVQTQGRGRMVDEWKQRPDKPDNHWLDCIVGCSVAASILGCSLEGMGAMEPKKRERVSFKAMQEARRKGRS
jgi:phage terminase large subunit GpA-like protein